MQTGFERPLLPKFLQPIRILYHSNYLQSLTSIRNIMSSSQLPPIAIHHGLLVTSTTSYTLRYNDKGSGAATDGAFWHPIGRDALKPGSSSMRLRPLGTVAVNNYDDLNGVGRHTALVGDCGENLVKSPTDYALIWSDKRSGAQRDGAVWRPVAPPGYVALGDVCSAGYDRPDLDDIWCVRSDLVVPVLSGARIWSDERSGGSYDLAAYAVTNESVRQNPSGPEHVDLLDASTFIGVSNYKDRPDQSLVNALWLNRPFL